jgi:hypothetical protein
MVGRTRMLLAASSQKGGDMPRVLILLTMAAVTLVLGATALWQTRYLVGGACLSVGSGTLFGAALEYKRRSVKDDA